MKNLFKEIIQGEYDNNQVEKIVGIGWQWRIREEEKELCCTYWVE